MEITGKCLCLSSSFRLGCAGFLFLDRTHIGHQLRYGMWVAQCLLYSSGDGVYTFVGTFDTFASSISNSVFFSFSFSIPALSLRPTSSSSAIAATTSGGLTGLPSAIGPAWQNPQRVEPGAAATS